MKNKYPVFIPTKGRYETPITIKMFQEHNIDFKIVIEKQEFEQYSKIVDKSKILDYKVSCLSDAVFNGQNGFKILIQKFAQDGF